VTVQLSCVILCSVRGRVLCGRDGDTARTLAIYLVPPDTIYRVLDPGKGSRVGRWEADLTRRDRRGSPDRQENTMSKRGRKRRSRKGNAANHGKRPNA